MLLQNKNYNYIVDSEESVKSKVTGDICNSKGHLQQLIYSLPITVIRTYFSSIGASTQYLWPVGIYLAPKEYNKLLSSQTVIRLFDKLLWHIN